MTKRVLITGVGGSIGCHVLKHLLVNTDWGIVGLDSFRHKGLTDRVTEVLDHKSERRLKIVTHDLMAPISFILSRQIGYCDFIINLASMSDVADSLADASYAVRSNVELMLTMLDYARRTRPKVFLHISTDEVYGPCGDRFHKEWDPHLPSSPYSASKACQEDIGIAYWRSYNVPLVLVNIMNNFGEMQNPAKFPSIVIRNLMLGKTVTVHGSPEAIGSRFYIHSRNAADAMSYILRNTEPYLHLDGVVDRPNRYNIVGSECYSNLDFAKLIADFMGKTLKYKFEPFSVTRPGHDWHYGLEGGKLADLGWKPPMELKESLRQTVAWYVQHPEWLEPK